MLIPKQYKGGWCVTPLEEWLDYLKNGHIKDDTQVPGLNEAKEKLQVMTMTPAERVAYDRHLDAIMVQEDVLSTAKIEGRAEGRTEGMEEANRENARKMKSLGIPADVITKVTGLSIEEQVEL